MFAKRRVLETLSQTMNWAFALLVPAWLLVSCTYVFNISDGLYELMADVVNVLAWIQGLAFVVILVLSFAVWATDYRFPAGLLLWSLVRTALSFAILVFVYAIDRITETGLAFSF